MKTTLSRLLSGILSLAIITLGNTSMLYADVSFIDDVADAYGLDIIENPDNLVVGKINGKDRLILKHDTCRVLVADPGDKALRKALKQGLKRKKL